MDILTNLVNSPLLFFLSILLPIVYGGVHLSAWTFDFPTRVEALLWKIACIDIMGTAVAVIAISAFAIAVWRTSRHWKSYRFFDWGGQFLVVLAIFFGFSRIYVVTEAFMSLHHVPIGVYSAVPWTQSIPHI